MKFKRFLSAVLAAILTAASIISTSVTSAAEDYYPYKKCNYKFKLTSYFDTQGYFIVDLYGLTKSELTELTEDNGYTFLAFDTGNKRHLYVETGNKPASPYISCGDLNEFDFGGYTDLTVSILNGNALDKSCGFRWKLRPTEGETRQLVSEFTTETNTFRVLISKRDSSGIAVFDSNTLYCDVTPKWGYNPYGDTSNKPGIFFRSDFIPGYTSAVFAIPKATYDLYKKTFGSSSETQLLLEAYIEDYEIAFMFEGDPESFYYYTGSDDTEIDYDDYFVKSFWTPSNDIFFILAYPDNFELSTLIKSSNGFSWQYHMTDGGELIDGDESMHFKITGIGKDETNSNIPTAPASLKASAKSPTSISLSWKSTNADSYNIYRSTSKDGTYKKIGTSEKAAYTDKTVTKGKTYYYKVTAVDISGESEFSDISSARAVAPAPSTVKASKAKSGAAKITWSKSTGASGYEIYMSTSADGGFKKIKSSGAGSARSFTKSGLKSGKTYYFKIRTYSKINGKKAYSGFSKTVKVTV